MKFTIRDLYWLILIAAILSAWFIDYRIQWALVARERLGAANAVQDIDTFNATLLEENYKLKNELKAMAARIPKSANEFSSDQPENQDSSGD